MMTTENNVRQLARARGYKISKIRSPYVADAYVILDYLETADAWVPVEFDWCDLATAEDWLRKQPTLERGR